MNPLSYNVLYDNVSHDFYLYRTDFPGPYVVTKTFDITFENPGMCVDATVVIPTATPTPTLTPTPSPTPTPTSCIPAYPSSFYASAGQDTGDEIGMWTHKVYQTSDSGSVTFNPDTDEYVYFTYPIALGTATFTDLSINIAGSWDGASWLDNGVIGDVYGPITIKRTVDNINQDFYLYRTDFPGIGNKTFQIDFQYPGLFQEELKTLCCQKL